MPIAGKKFGTEPDAIRLATFGCGPNKANIGSIDIGGGTSTTSNDKSGVVLRMPFEEFLIAVGQLDESGTLCRKQLEVSTYVLPSVCLLHITYIVTFFVFLRSPVCCAGFDVFYGSYAHS
jgi:hypothetical protein